LSVRLFDRLHIDDPVGAVSVHGVSGIWGMLAVGLFMREEKQGGLNGKYVGLFHGGGWDSLGVQALATVCIMAWAAVTTLIIFGLLAIIPCLGLRMSPEDEKAGADYVEHKLGPRAVKEWEESHASLPETVHRRCCTCIKPAYGEDDDSDMSIEKNRRTRSMGTGKFDQINPSFEPQEHPGLHQRKDAKDVEDHRF